MCLIHHETNAGGKYWIFFEPLPPSDHKCSTPVYLSLQ